MTAFNAATPVFGVGIAVTVLGDPLSPWLFLAAAAVAGGIVLVNRRAERREPPVSRPAHPRTEG